MIKIYEVGGSVRDAFLGIENSDIDHSVEAPSYEAMLEHIKANSAKIICDNNGDPIGKDYLTVRAIDYDGMGKDYVLCRKEGTYSDQRRPDFVSPGTIYDDLKRRDFTVNAMAVDSVSGKLIDPHRGLQDIAKRRLRTVGKAEDRFMEDPLRLIRAIRFAITKDLTLDDDIKECLSNDLWAKQLGTISEERIRQELTKCFKFNTYLTLAFLHEMLSPEMLCVIFDDMDIWLLPTNKKR